MGKPPPKVERLEPQNDVFPIGRSKLPVADFQVTPSLNFMGVSILYHPTPTNTPCRPSQQDVFGHTNDAGSELQELETDWCRLAAWKRRVWFPGIFQKSDLDTIKNGWFTIGNPYENWMILGVYSPILGNTHIYHDLPYVHNKHIHKEVWWCQEISGEITSRLPDRWPSGFLRVGDVPIKQAFTYIDITIITDRFMVNRC